MTGPSRLSLQGLAATAGLALAAAHAGSVDARFAVHIDLTIPSGCSGSLGTSAEGSRLTLTCGDNLFVNVRPTWVSLSTGLAQAGSNGAAPPGESRGSEGERPTLDSVLSVQSTTTDTAATDNASPARSMQVALSRRDDTQADAFSNGQAVEMWLIF